MAKEINIPVKVPGADQAKQDIDKVAESTKKVGNEIQDVGKKSSQTEGLFNKFSGAVKAVFGLAIVAYINSAIAKVKEFFNEMKARTSEAVQDLEKVRGAFKETFEIMDAFSEKSRQKVTKEALDLFTKLAIPKEEALPIYNEYYRQFHGMVKEGKITEQQFQKGLKETLTYGVLHGGQAMPEMIQQMQGWGMNTPAEQGQYMRMITAAAGASGLREEDIVTALGRGMPTIRAMGWTPQQAIAAIAMLAKGETGKEKLALPVQTLEALLSPSVEKFKEYKLTPELAQSPEQLLFAIQQKAAKMPPKAGFKMLQDIYGQGGAKGVLKLLTTYDESLYKAIDKAAGPEGIQQRIREERDRLKTVESEQGRGQDIKDKIDLTPTVEDVKEKNIFDIQEKIKREIKRRHPYIEIIRKSVPLPFPNLIFDIIEEQKTRETAEKRYEKETSKQPNVIIQYNHNMNFHPTVGSNIVGPRAPVELP